MDVNGTIYYGCCTMCVDRLQNDPTVRESIDPVSGNAVDKAAAIIGAKPDGTVYYFESEENLAKFNAEHEPTVTP